MKNATCLIRPLALTLGLGLLYGCNGGGTSGSTSNPSSGVQLSSFSSLSCDAGDPYKLCDSKYSNGSFDLVYTNDKQAYIASINSDEKPTILKCSTSMGCTNIPLNANPAYFISMASDSNDNIYIMYVDTDSVGHLNKLVNGEWVSIPLPDNSEFTDFGNIKLAFDNKNNLYFSYMDASSVLKLYVYENNQWLDLSTKLNANYTDYTDMINCGGDICIAFNDYEPAPVNSSMVKVYRINSTSHEAVRLGDNSSPISIDGRWTSLAYDQSTSSLYLSFMNNPAAGTGEMYDIYAYQQEAWAKIYDTNLNVGYNSLIVQDGKFLSFFQNRSDSGSTPNALRINKQNNKYNLVGLEHLTGNSGNEVAATNANGDILLGYSGRDSGNYGINLFTADYK